MTISEIMDELNEAIALVEEAKAKVDAAAKQAGCYSHYTAYGRYGFDTLLGNGNRYDACLLYTSPSPRDGLLSRMPSSA